MHSFLFLAFLFFSCSGGGDGGGGGGAPAQEANTSTSAMADSTPCPSSSVSHFTHAQKQIQQTEVKEQKLASYNPSVEGLTRGQEIYLELVEHAVENWVKLISERATCGDQRSQLLTLEKNFNTSMTDLKASLTIEISAYLKKLGVDDYTSTTLLKDFQENASTIWDNGLKEIRQTLSLIPANTPATGITPTATATVGGSGTSAETEPTTPAATSIASDCANPGPGLGTSNIPYKKVSIIKHGQYALGPLVDGARFNSNLDLPPVPPDSVTNIFDTDSTLRIRIKAKPVVSYGPGQASPGCRWGHQYSQMQVNVGLRSSSAAPYQLSNYNEHFTVTVPVEGCSAIRDITNIPKLEAGQHLALDIYNVMTDWVCFQDPSQCVPLLQFHSKDSCWQLELHVQTDHTKAIP